MDEGVRSALFVNLLTEDNLPHYFRTIDGLFGVDQPWGAWSKRWTAEEGRHAIVIRDYLTVTRSVDPVALERGRMAQVSLRRGARARSVVDGLVYVTLQELATRISHRNTGRLLEDRTRLRDHGPGGGRREPAPRLLPGRHQRRARGRPLDASCSPSSARSGASTCPAPASPTTAPTPGPSPMPASTTSPSTTTTSSSRSS